MAVSVFCLRSSLFDGDRLHAANDGGVGHRRPHLILSTLSNTNRGLRQHRWGPFSYGVNNATNNKRRRQLTAGRLFLIIIALAMAIAAIKLAILALLIAALIFRPSETVGLLIVFGLFALVWAHPVIGLGAVAATITLGFIMKQREDRAVKALDDPDQE